MKTFFLSLTGLIVSLSICAQWNTDLTTNLVISDNGRIENVIYDGNGYYLTWQEGAGPFTHKVTRLNVDGTSNWNAPILAHNHDLGSFTVSLQHTAMDVNRNFIRVSTYINNDGEFCCINKIDTTGTQLFNGESGLVYPGLAMGFALGASGNMYLLVNTELKKIDADGNTLWSATLDPSHLNSREGKIIESADGTVGVAYFVPGMGNPTYGNFYISRFDSVGNRTTVGSQTIAPASCSFYRPWYFTESYTGHYYFIGFDTNSSVSFVQHLMGDEPMVGGNGTPLDNSANSSFITATVAGDSLFAFYQYNWNSFDEGGLKMQAIDLAGGTHAYNQGLNLYNETAGIRPFQHSAIDLNGYPACLILESPSQVARLLEVGENGMNTYPLFTSSTSKGLAAISSFNQINATQKQCVAFLEDYRAGNDYSACVAQNLTLDGSTGVAQLSTSGELIVFPNPAHNNLRMQADDKWLGSTCSLYDQLGRELDSFKLTQRNMTLDIKSLPAGVYFIGINNEKEHFFERVIVE
jgi:hypothetical protein